MVWAATVKMRSELRKNFKGTFLLIGVFLWLQANFTAVQSPGIGLSSIRKRIFRLSCLTFLRNYCPRGLLLNCSNRNCPKTSQHRIHRISWLSVRICCSDCEYCSVGSFNLCLNANFLGAWSDRILLSPFFVLYVKKGCDSPSVAMLTSQSVWNNRSVKAYFAT